MSWHNGNIDLNSPYIMSASAACELWGIDNSTLRKAVERFPEGTIRKFGKTWVVTKYGMNRVFGKRKEEKRREHKEGMSQ